MKILFYADAHFCEQSSIVFQGRLEALTKSFQFLYEVADKEKVDAIVNLGDLTDSPKLNSKEITAVTQALSFRKDSSLPEYHLLGNHERVSEDGFLNSVNFLNISENRELVKDITVFEDKSITLIPYGTYQDGCLDQYPDTKYAFTHIDIKGSDLGGWIEKKGMSIDYLMSKYDIVINGHIHKHSVVYSDDVKGKYIVNLGSVSGQNFSSSGYPLIGLLTPSLAYIHGNYTYLDKITFTNYNYSVDANYVLSLIKNFEGINFVSKTCNSVSDIMKAVNELTMKSAVQLKVPSRLLEDARNIVNQRDSVIAVKLKINTDSADKLPLIEEVIETVDTDSQGFTKLKQFISEKKKLPYEKESILAVVDELMSSNSY